jgi:hypothetical protein
MKRILIVILFLLANIGASNANIFKNFTEVNSCISGYNSFNDYKSKLQSCYKDKGIEFDQGTLDSLSKKRNVIKESGFNLKKYTKKENISKLKKYTYNNPDKIYGITEDINSLYKSELITADVKNNLLFQSYNSFSIQNLQILSSQGIFNSVKGFSKKVIKAYKDGATITDKVVKIYKVAKDQVIVNTLKENIIIAAATTASGYVTVEQLGLFEDEQNVPTVTFSTSVGSLDEDDNQTITITATLLTPAKTALTIDFSPTGSATEGTDYTTINSISISPGDLTGTTEFTLTDDSIYEGDETISLTVNKSSSVGSFNTVLTSVINITENESAPVVTLSTSATSIAEDAGSSLTITATISQVADEDVTVSIATAGTALEGTDYSTISDITVSAGSTTGTASFTPTDDNIFEADETAIVSISSVTGADATESGTQSETITISADGDAAPSVTLATSASSIDENAGTSLTLTATLSNPTNADVTVSLSTGGTGTEGTDYSTISDITISAGSTTGTASFTPTDDSVYEGDETAIVSISSVSGGSATESGTQSVTITINENESAPTVTLTTSATSIDENSGSVLTLTATLSNATTADVTVSIATSGTATEGTDYTDGSGNIDDIVISAGSTSETISFRPTDDSVYEGDETATVSISGVSGGSATESGTQAVSILFQKMRVHLLLL